MLESRLEGISLSAARFAVAATTLCPLMSVLGAKRPQDRGWQWVVLTLWIVLVWPAAQAVVLPAGIRVELFIAWKIFLWGLIGLGLLNYLPTRHWRASVLVALGQILLLREHLGLPEATSTQISQLVAVLSFVSAAAIVTSSRKSASLATNAQTLAKLNSQWLQFRDHYGAFWALRSLARINQSGEQHDWPVRLDWAGFVSVGDAQPNELQLETIRQALDSILRRFIESGPSQ